MKKLWPLIFIAVALIVVVAAALVSRSHLQTLSTPTSLTTRPIPKPESKQGGMQSKPEEPPQYPNPPPYEGSIVDRPYTPTPGNPEKSRADLQSIERLVRSQVYFYLKGVREGNQKGQSAKMKRMRIHREMALKFAQEFLDRAQTEEERKIILDLVEAIRRES